MIPFPGWRIGADHNRGAAGSDTDQLPLQHRTLPIAYQDFDGVVQAGRNSDRHKPSIDHGRYRPAIVAQTLNRGSGAAGDRTCGERHVNDAILPAIGQRQRPGCGHSCRERYGIGNDDALRR